MHVGIMLNQTLTCKDTVQLRVRKARTALFSIMSIEENIGDVNPITMSRLVKSIVIPTALYGVELWANLTMSDLLHLEKLVLLAAKKIQHFPRHTRTDMALSMIGWHCMEYEIDNENCYSLRNFVQSRLLPKQTGFSAIDCTCTLHEDFNNKVVTSQTFAGYYLNINCSII